MAKLLGNMLQGLSGRLGNVVGYNWNGLWCVRSRPVSVRNPRTAAQQAHREQFRQEVQLAAAMRYALIKGFGGIARENHMTPQNLFMRLNRDAFGWSDEGLTVDYAGLVLSVGPASAVVFETPEIDADNVLTVRFRKHRPGGSGGAFDNVFVFVYSPVNKLGYLAAPALRRDGRVSFVLPEWMTGGELQMWGFVQDERGRCSETLYLGQADVPDGVDVSDFSDVSDGADVPDDADVSDDTDVQDFTDVHDVTDGTDVSDGVDGQPPAT